ncbi:hypothetical protein AX14_007629 [Amanita brunnescens Koide BX004]|nr:hypothetical protein AX14_007629 [Amanita brunnescens Koide BX004]
MMPTAAARMPLRTSQDAPRFLGTADDLPRYITEVEELCKSRQKSSNPELVKWAVYYVDGNLWDSLALTRDALADPASWEDFKRTLHEVFPQHKVASRSASLAASLPPLPMPSALLPSPLPATPIGSSLPQPPAPAVTLSLATLNALLSPTLSNMPKVPNLPQLSPATAPLSPIQLRLLHTPAPALRSPSIPPAPKPLHAPTVAQLLSNALHLLPFVEAPQLPMTTLLLRALSPSHSPSPLPCSLPVTPALKSPSPATQQMLPAAPIILPLPPPTQAPISLSAAPIMPSLHASAALPMPPDELAPPTPPAPLVTHLASVTTALLLPASRLRPMPAVTAFTPPAHG